jgi:DNA-directed RNA polymerases I and III subunit RPAC1
MANKVTFEMRNDAPHQVFSVSEIPAEERKKPYPEQIRNRLRLQCSVEGPELMVFDMVGVDVSLANALRRIMLAEVATMAGEYVYIDNNTSIIFDEVLAHRLGLVPLNADPDKFNMVEKGTQKKPQPPAAEGDSRRQQQQEEEQEEKEETDDHNTVVFRLYKKFLPPPPGERAPPLDDGRPPTMNVLSGDFEWIPQGDQKERFPQGIGPLHKVSCGSSTSSM